jgi:hypothetical protein
MTRDNNNDDDNDDDEDDDDDSNNNNNNSKFRLTKYGTNKPAQLSYSDVCTHYPLLLACYIPNHVIPYYYYTSADTIMCYPIYQYNDRPTQLFTKYQYIWLWPQCFDPLLGHHQAYKNDVAEAKYIYTW